MPHGDFEFRIDGTDESQVRRWRRAAETARAGSWWKWTWPPGIVLPVIAVFWAVPTLDFDTTGPSVTIGGQEVAGARVLLVQDGSGSMGSLQPIVDARLAALQAASAYSGFGCKTTDREFLDFVDCIVNQTRAAKVDAFYVLADFRWAGVNDGDVARAREALSAGATRLYLETVSDEPDGRLAALAAATGGAIIHTPK